MQVRSLTAGSPSLLDELALAIGVEARQDFAWPLPNAEPVSAPVYWSRYMAGGPVALIEIGVSKVDDRACRVFATYERDGRDHSGGVAVAIDVRSLGAKFFTWSTCRHDYAAEHDEEASVYACRSCGHSYRIEVAS